jgi:hypothetical protein
MAEIHLPGGEAAAHPSPHHEERDVNIRAILTFGAGLVVTAIVIHVLVWLLFVYFNAREAAQPPPEYPLAAEQEKRLPPEPRLQTNPREDLRELRAGEDEALTTYGWVDRNGGVVRIPIDEAMKLVVQRGLPARAPQRER